VFQQQQQHVQSPVNEHIGQEIQKHRMWLQSNNIFENGIHM
jgi:hypothetical protein